MAYAFHAVAALLLVLLVVHGSDAFGVKVPSRSASRSSSLAVAVTLPPRPLEQVVAATTVQTTSSSSSASNFPSPKELSKKSTVAAAPLSSTPTPTPPKSTNIASGTALAISDIHYNGDVPTTEADEYVAITNNLKTPVDVSGYCLYVATTGTQGPTFTFPKGGVVPPGKAVRIYTNEIHTDTGGYSFKSGKAIWNNKGGLAVLKDAKGKKVMEYKYKG
jgi:hypothetical protein